MQDLLVLRAYAESSKTSGIVHGYMIIDCNEIIWLLDRLEEAEKEVKELEDKLQLHYETHGN